MSTDSWTMSGFCTRGGCVSLAFFYFLVSEATAAPGADYSNSHRGDTSPEAARRLPPLHAEESRAVFRSRVRGRGTSKSRVASTMSNGESDV